jgi:hypothetical protein
MKFPKISRRKFIAAGVVAMSGAVITDAKWVEPTHLKVGRLRIGKTPTHRLIHFTDLHHKGDQSYLRSVVNKINELKPDTVCFTGDIIEEEKFLDEALQILAEIKAPMFGVPGNHDYWSQVSFEPIKKCFTATAGAWLMDESRQSKDGKINFIGLTCERKGLPLPVFDQKRLNVLLIHYPAWVKKLGEAKFDLVLAGHSHGGQVRIPFYGAVMVPYGVDEFDMGLFQTKAGPLYVNSGIGYVYGYNFRFNCRPEITVIEI